MLVQAAIERGQWWLVFMIVLSSLLAIVYVWRFVEIAYFREPPDDHPPSGEAPLSLLVPALLMIAACVWFGLDASWSGSMARAAAEALAGGWK